MYRVKSTLLTIQGAVDMDIYGAFQLCAIGILAAPVTVRLSQTYFDKPGRNAIFLWTGIIVAGKSEVAVKDASPVTKKHKQF